MSKLPPYNRGSESSRAAAEGMRIKAPAMKERVLALLELMLPGGLTSEEAERYTGGLHQSVSARLNELEHEGKITKQRFARRNESGAMADVYYAIAGPPIPLQKSKHFHSALECPECRALHEDGFKKGVEEGLERARNGQRELF